MLTSTLMSAWVSYLVALVPTPATGDRFMLGDCGDYEDKIDPIAQTEIGINMLKNLGRNPGLTMIFWDSNEVETAHRCLKLEYDLDLGYYKYSYIDSTGARSEERGRVAFTMSPTTRIQFYDTAGKEDPKINALSPCPGGVSELFPAHISHKELLLLGCCHTALGRRETLYVLTTEDVSTLNLQCAKRTIEAATGRAVTTPSNACADAG